VIFVYDPTFTPIASIIRMSGNTMAAFIKARELEADAIEFDVHMTSDGVPVVIHDYDLARTTSGVGYVYEQTVENLRALDAGLWFGDHSPEREFRCSRKCCPSKESILSWKSKVCRH